MAGNEEIGKLWISGVMWISLWRAGLLLVRGEAATAPGEPGVGEKASRCSAGRLGRTGRGTARAREDEAVVAWKAGLTREEGGSEAGESKASQA